MKTIMALVAYSATRGVPPPELLRAAGLDAAQLGAADASLLHAEELRLWDEAVRLTGDEDLGLHLGEWAMQCPEEHFDVLAFALRSCATLGDHYRRAGRYLRLLHDGIYLSLEEEGDEARLVHGHVPERVGPRCPVEGMLAMLVLQGRRAIGEDFAPREVRLMHERPARIGEQERIFRAPLRYGWARNELVLDRALLGRPQRQAEPRMLAMLERQLEGMLAGIAEVHRFQAEVRSRMMEELPDREPAMAAVAARLHMSPRSLQRRLRDEGTSFAEVLTQLRRDLALRYLKDPRIGVCEVGFLLGFLDVTAFHRAFKRWTGTTPAEYRRGGRGGHG